MTMKTFLTRLLSVCLLASAAQAVLAQETLRQSILQLPVLPRLAPTLLDAAAPASRVSGIPGSLRIEQRSCRNGFPDSALRQRIVALAVQEWAAFGFLVDDLRESPDEFTTSGQPRWRLSLDPEEVQQVAATIAGYWSATPGSDWILNRQNEAWQRPEGLGTRWRDPWSAAFISWVMCESGLGEQERFQRAVAHHSYIDQAIRASDNAGGMAAYHAFQPGEAEIRPGDMLCSGLRPLYQNLQQRRAQLGEGARTHCDIVVEVDAQTGQILTIGGNVRASVRMKLYAAGAHPVLPHLTPLPVRRPLFAHLQLQLGGSDDDTLEHTPTLQQLACSMPAAPVTFALLELEASDDVC
jgi:hypothetical protein